MNKIISQFLTGSLSSLAYNQPNKTTHSYSKAAQYSKPSENGIADNQVTLQSTSDLSSKSNILPNISSSRNKSQDFDLPSSKNTNSIFPKIQLIKQKFYAGLNDAMSDAHQMNKISISSPNLGYPSQKFPNPKHVRNSSEPLQLLNTAEDINDNLNLFKLEMINDLKAFQRTLKKMKLCNLSGELSELKSKFAQDIQDTNKAREEKISKLIEEFRAVKLQIGTHMTNETNNNQDSIIHLASLVRNYKSDMDNRLLSIEEKQKMEIEQIQLMLSNSSNEKLKQFAKKILPTKTREEFEQAKEIFVAPRKEDISLLVERFNRKKGKEGTVVKDCKMIEVLEKKKQMNSIIKEEYENEEEGIEEFKKENEGGMNISTRAKYTMKQGFKKNVEIAKKTLREKGMTSKASCGNLSKLRGFVYAIIAQKRLHKILSEAQSKVKMARLKYLGENFIIVDDYLQNWVKVSTKSALNSVTSFKSLNLDITTENIGEAFLKIRARLQGIIEDLEENTNETKINSNLKEFFKCILQDNGIIPFRFFSLFEISRLEISEDCEIINMTEKQKIMIICMYILIKILIHNIILVKTLPQIKNRQVSKNLKIIASILFHSVVKYIMDHNPILQRISSIEDMISKQEKKRKGKVAGDRDDGKKVLSSLNRKIKWIASDCDPDDIKWISHDLYKYSELTLFCQQAKKSKFDLSQLVSRWADKMLRLINVT